ncbi:MAG: restriction endonuclease subunit S [Methanobacteriaceae archaeon]|nr:restriction endonuclease subunit S [Methanobacteriaceae archaeon]
MNNPKLRFPEFSGELVEKKLGDIAIFSKGKNISKDDISDEGVLCIRYGELYTTYEEKISKVFSKTNLDPSKLVFSKENDVIIPTSGETAIDLATASCVLDSGIAIGGDTTIIKVEGNGLFISYYLNSKKTSIAKLAQGASVVHLYSSHLKTIDIKVPEIGEQEKISHFLSIVDDKLDFIEKKRDLWKTYSAGMMQQLFSQKLRFKEENGEDYPDWETGTIKDVMVQKIRKVKKPESSYWRLGLRSHAKGTFHEFVTDPTKIAMDYLFVVRENDLILNITFAWEHAIALADKEDENLLVSHRFPTYQFFENVNPLFYKYFVKLPKFKYELMNISPGGAGRNRVMRKNDFLKIEIPIPSKSEQNKIANFLSIIDNKLEQIEKEFIINQEFKKGLLQQLFC